MAKEKPYLKMAMYMKEHGKTIWYMGMENWLLMKIKLFMKASLDSLKNKVREILSLIIAIRTSHIMVNGQMISFKARV